MSAHGNDVRAREPAALERAVKRAAPIFDALLDPKIVDGAHHLAATGPALVVGNHSGGTLAMLEPLVLARALARHVAIESIPHLLLHEVLWHTPLAPWLARVGAVRASRPNAEGLFALGQKVLVYPGGDREVYRSFRDRDRLQFGERRGYLQLAIANGVPLVPVVTAGMHSSFFSFTDGHALAQRLPLARRLRVGVLPITLGFPFGLVPFAPPPYVPIVGRVRIRVLAPIHFTRRGPEAAADEAYVEACHRVVTGTMQRALGELAQARRSERRATLHDRLDRIVDAIERWTAPHCEEERPSLEPALRLVTETRPRRISRAA
ncbi:MAG: hypothetical protein U0234_22485 [Sandaracinus sp.]